MSQPHIRFLLYPRPISVPCYVADPYQFLMMPQTHISSLSCRRPISVPCYVADPYQFLVMSQTHISSLLCRRPISVPCYVAVPYQFLVMSQTHISSLLCLRQISVLCYVSYPYHFLVMSPTLISSSLCRRSVPVQPEGNTGDRDIVHGPNLLFRCSLPWRTVCERLPAAVPARKWPSSRTSLQEPQGRRQLRVSAVNERKFTWPVVSSLFWVNTSCFVDA